MAGVRGGVARRSSAGTGGRHCSRIGRTAALGPQHQLAACRRPPVGGEVRPTTRRPLYLQLRSMVQQVRTSARGLERWFLPAKLGYNKVSTSFRPQGVDSGPPGVLARNLTILVHEVDIDAISGRDNFEWPPGRPKIWARKAAEARLSRHHTIVWLNSTVMLHHVTGPAFMSTDIRDSGSAALPAQQ